MTARDLDAIQLLTIQHRALERMMDNLLEEDDVQQKIALFERASDELSVHIASEEQVFYPAVNAARTEDNLMESLEEHLSLKRLLADLLEMDPGDKAFEAKFKVLKEQTEHHHREEEEHLFPKVMRMISQEQRMALGRDMLELQQSLAQEGDPRENVVDETDAAAPLGRPQDRPGAGSGAGPR